MPFLPFKFILGVQYLSYRIAPTKGLVWFHSYEYDTQGLVYTLSMILRALSTHWVWHSGPCLASFTLSVALRALSGFIHTEYGTQGLVYSFIHTEYGTQGLVWLHLHWLWHSGPCLASFTLSMTLSALYSFIHTEYGTQGLVWLHSHWVWHSGPCITTVVSYNQMNYKRLSFIKKRLVEYIYVFSCKNQYLVNLSQRECFEFNYLSKQPMGV